MTLGALLDAGAGLAAIEAGLRTLGLAAFELRPEPVVRAGMRALIMHVEISEERTYQPADMRVMLAAAPLAPRVRERGVRAIEALADGEARAHATATPHFHEAGGVD